MTRAPGGFLQEPLGGKGQGDIMVPDWVDGRVLICDVRQTHPVQANQRAERLASEHTGGWVKEVEQDKRQHLEGLLTDAIDAGLPAECRHSIRLAPLVVDSYGCWGPAAEELLQECASRRPAPQRSAALRRWRAALNIAVFRESSRLLRVRAGEGVGAWRCCGRAAPPTIGV